MDIVLKNQDGERRKLLGALEDFARQHSLPPAVVQAADLALEELITNIFNYAYDQAGPRDIRVRFLIDGDCLQIEVEDDGKPFDPLERPEPDISLPLDDKPIGGLGIYLVRRSMDEVQYRRHAGKNLLVMRKRLGTSPVQI